MKTRNKLVLAAGVAALGLGLAYLLYQRWAANLPTSADALSPLEEERRKRLLRAAISISADIVPTAPALDEILREATEGASEAIALLRPRIERPDDLVKAFEEQLHATLDGNFERRVGELNARGYKLDPNSVDERKRWEYMADRSRWTRIGLSQLRVEPVYIEGVAVDSVSAREYESTTEFTRSGETTPLSRDIQGQRLTIIQISLPMELSRIKTSDRALGVTGYRFAWNRDAKQWTPWSTKVWKTDDHPVLCPPF